MAAAEKPPVRHREPFIILVGVAIASASLLDAFWLVPHPSETNRDSSAELLLKSIKLRQMKPLKWTFQVQSASDWTISRSHFSPAAKKHKMSLVERVLLKIA